MYNRAKVAPIKNIEPCGTLPVVNLASDAICIPWALLSTTDCVLSSIRFNQFLCNSNIYVLGAGGLN